MRKLLGIALVACLVVTVGADDKKKEKDPLAGLKCPISGKKINPKGTAEHNGNTIYFCCTNCPKAFASNPAKWAAKANLQAVQSGQAKQVKCPLRGKPINPAQSVTVEGVKVGLCCPGCKGKASKAADPVALIFGDETFKKGFASAKAEEE